MVWPSAELLCTWQNSKHLDDTNHQSSDSVKIRQYSWYHAQDTPKKEKDLLEIFSMFYDLDSK